MMNDARDRTALVLAAYLERMAARRGAEPDDLSGEEVAAAYDLVLEGFRLGAEYAHDRDTIREPPAPDEAWDDDPAFDDDVTPIFPANDKDRSK